MKYEVGDRIKCDAEIGIITEISDNGAYIYIKWNDNNKSEMYSTISVDHYMYLLKPINRPDRSSA